MPLFLSCEESRDERAGLGQHADLVVELVQRDAEILSKRCDTSSVRYCGSLPGYSLGVLLPVTSIP